MTQKDDGRTQTSWLRYSHLGLQFAMTLTLLALAGTWADARWGTGPWLTVTGCLVGIAASLYLFIREALR